MYRKSRSHLFKIQNWVVNKLKTSSLLPSKAAISTWIGAVIIESKNVARKRILKKQLNNQFNLFSNCATNAVVSLLSAPYLVEIANIYTKNEILSEEKSMKKRKKAGNAEQRKQSIWVFLKQNNTTKSKKENSVHPHVWIRWVYAATRANVRHLEKAGN